MSIRTLQDMPTLRFVKIFLEEARWDDKAYTNAPRNSLSLRKFRVKEALEAYKNVFQMIQTLMVDSPLDLQKMDAYLARLQPFTFEACQAYYFWRSACLRGESYCEVLDLAEAALEAFRRGVDFVLAEYEKAFGERLE